MDELKNIIQVKATMFNYYLSRYSRYHEAVDREIGDQYYYELNAIFATLKAVGYKVSFIYKTLETERYDLLESVTVNGKVMFREEV